MDKIKVYVSSLRGVSPLNYVDKESIGHPCVTSRHGEDVFSEYKHYPGSGGGYLSENQRRIVDMAVEFCKKNNLEYEIVDIANLNFISKIELLFKGIKAPTISFKGKKIEGAADHEDLKALIAK